MSRCLFTLIIIVLSVSQLFAESKPSDIVQQYIDRIKTGKWQEAENLWHPDVIKKSERLQITYNDVNIKFDCASPVYTSLDGLKSGQVNFILGSTIKKPDYVRVLYSLCTYKDTISAAYYLVKRNDDWKIVSPQYALCQSWTSINTEFFNVHYQDSSLINQYAIKDLDHFVHNVADELQLETLDLDLLEKQKIDYYLCSKDQFTDITAYNAHGLYDIPSDAIITRNLPHKHEMVHLLVNFKMHDNALYTIPIFQEGIAVALGGRWGKSSKVLLDFGQVLVNNGFIFIDSILTTSGFNRAGPADMTYPVAGLFVENIINLYGMNNYLDLYRGFSGSIENFNEMTPFEFRKGYRKFTGSNPDSLIDALTGNTKGFYAGIIEWNDSIPDNIVKRVSNNETSCQAFKGCEDYIFQIDLPEPNKNVALLMADSNSNINPHYQSWMFAEQFPEKDYDGYRYGLVITPAEIGLYDYYLNELLAKTIIGLYPYSDYSKKDGLQYLFAFQAPLVDLESYQINLIDF